MKIIGWGWSDLWLAVTQWTELAKEIEEIFLITTVYAGEPWRYQETYAVVLRIGWTEVYTGGTIAGLTKEQWAFLHCTSPKARAVLAIGKWWPGLDKAIEIAEKAGCRVNKYCIKMWLQQLK